MKLTAFVTLVYGLVVLLCGLYAFFTNESTWALVFGVVIGIILIGNAYGTFNNNFTGVYITILLSISLSVIFAIRLTLTLRVLPVGLMFICSVIALGFSVYSLQFRKTSDDEEED